MSNVLNKNEIEDIMNSLEHGVRRGIPRQSKILIVLSGGLIFSAIVLLVCSIYSLLKSEYPADTDIFATSLEASLDELEFTASSLRIYAVPKIYDMRTENEGDLLDALDILNPPPLYLLPPPVPGNI